MFRLSEYFRRTFLATVHLYCSRRRFGDGLMYFQHISMTNLNHQPLSISTACQNAETFTGISLLLSDGHKKTKSLL